MRLFKTAGDSVFGAKVNRVAMLPVLVVMLPSALIRATDVAGLQLEDRNSNAALSFEWVGAFV